jgi:hypothetical protein
MLLPTVVLGALSFGILAELLLSAEYLRSGSFTFLAILY